jgi:transporter family protein
MSYWLIAVAATMFGLYNVFIKVSADDIHEVLGAVVLQVVATLIGLGLLLYLKATSSATLHVSGRGLLLASLAGVAIGLVEILSFVIYARGIPVAVGNPLIVGGSLVVTTGVGIALLHEALSGWQIAAIVLIAAGIGVFAWDAAR